MRELTILYAGPALAGKRESIVQLAKLLPTARLEVFGHGPQIQVPVLALANERVSLRVTAKSGPVFTEDLDEKLRAAADAVVFVIDSQRERWEANEECLRRIAEHIDTRNVPLVWQANRRDLPNRLSVRELASLDRWNAPIFESVAPKGIGVWEPFEAIALALARLHGLDAEMRAVLAQRRP